MVAFFDKAVFLRGWVWSQIGGLPASGSIRRWGRLGGALFAVSLMAGCPGKAIDVAGAVAGTAVRTTGAVVGGAIDIVTFVEQEKADYARLQQTAILQMNGFQSHSFEPE